jgi:tetratricopeptide (TPR) repeat protein
MLPGDVVAERFEVEQLIGSGGMGDVYCALDRASGARVALKVLRAQGGDFARLLREAEILAELENPGIVRHVAHGLSGDGSLYLAMEWLDGEDLQHRLAHAPLTVSESVTLVTRLAEALAVVHAIGVIHRDLKPSNVFLPGGAAESAKILDFGIARGSGAVLTMAGHALGTPAYMAPEQVRSARDVTTSADVFSLGCLLFECLTGRPTFAAEHTVAILGKILFEEAPRVRDLRPDVPLALDALVARMLSKSPGERPADGAALLEELWALGEVSGAAPALESPPRLLTAGEQRLLSVVMISNAASDDERAQTIAAGTLDPVLARLHMLASRHGARVDQVGFSTLLAVFAISGSATDQAASAARFALDVREELPSARVVVATGRGVVSDRWPVGDAIDRAAVLLRDTGTRAHPDVILDATTAGLVEARFDLRHTDGRIVLLRERDHLHGARLLLGRPTPCVGRDRELALIETILAESAQDSVARAVLVTAAAGGGKSRLLSELLLRIQSPPEDAPQQWVGRADAPRAGSPFSLLAPLLRAAAEVHEGDALAVQQERLRARVARHVDPARQRRVSEFLGELVGAPFAEEPGSALQAARRDPVLMFDQMARAFEELVDAELSVGPLLIALEDVHWGDLPSLSFLDRVLRNLKHRPLTVIAMARPEVRETFPNLWGERELLEIRLGRLGAKAAARLVHVVLGDGFAAERVRAIVERADGNAFYLEELIRAESEGRHDDLPDTVLAMVQMRLDALPDGARRLLRAGSVFGESFWVGGVDALLGQRAGETTARLRDLVDREAVQPVEATRFPGHPEYRFRHAIVREAAYSLLTDADRVLGHRLAAQWLAENGENDASMLAEHYRLGGAPELAIGLYLRAADHALEANDLAGALLRADEGIACGAAGGELGELQRVKADAHRWSGRVAPADDCAAAAMVLLEPGSVGWCKAAETCAVAATSQGSNGAPGRVEELIERLLAAPEHPGSAVFLCGALCMLARSMFLLSRFEDGRRLLARIEPLVASFGGKERVAIAQVSHLRAVAARMDGDVSSSVRLNEIALAEYEALGALRQKLFIANNLGDCLLEVGAYERVVEVVGAVLSVSETMALDRETALGNLNVSVAWAALGRTAEALACVERALALYTATSNQRYRAEGLVVRAGILAATGDLDAAAASAREAVEVAAPFPSTTPRALALLAVIELRRGHGDVALTLARDASEKLAALGSILEGGALVRLAYARALRASGAVEEAKAAITEARRRIMRSAELIGDEALRRSFLERVSEHAETLKAAEEWGEPTAIS